jgi:PAS domain-containing protein
MMTSPPESATPVRVLFVEDSDDDVQLMIWELRRAGYEPIYGRVDTAAALRAALRARDWDLAIVDFDMPRFSAPEALGVIREHGADLPCITVSGIVQEEMVLSTLRLGAVDYLLKANLVRLPAAVERELAMSRGRLERLRSQRALQGREAYARAVIDTLPDAIVVVDDGYRIELFNRAAEVLLGYQASEIIGAHLRVLFMDLEAPGTGRELAVRKDGATVAVELAVGTTRMDGRDHFSLRLLDLGHGRLGLERPPEGTRACAQTETS